MRLGGIEVTPAGLDAEAGRAARARQDELTKPPGSLGRLESISIRLCEVTGSCPPSLGGKVVLVCAADHGVTEEGVSPYPREVTRQMLLNFAGGGAAINVLASAAGARVVLLDVGTCVPVDHPAVMSRRVRAGTANIARGPAMTTGQAEECVLAGYRAADGEISRGAGMLAVGEMGIGNTSSASAVVASLTGKEVRGLVGRGTGLDDEGLERKVRVVEEAVRLNRPDRRDAMDVLSKVGGLEIGAMAGAMLACAERRVPVVVDGFISSAAALLAETMCPGASAVMFASHLSSEPGHAAALDALGLAPFLVLEMRLGEGTGAALAFTVLEAAARVLGEMATFDEAGVSREDDR